MWVLVRGMTRDTFPRESAVYWEIWERPERSPARVRILRLRWSVAAILPKSWRGSMSPMTAAVPKRLEMTLPTRGEPRLRMLGRTRTGGRGQTILARGGGGGGVREGA